MNDKEPQKLGKWFYLVAIIPLVCCFALTIPFNYFTFHEGWKAAVIGAAKFWGIMAALGIGWGVLEWQFKKDAKRCVIWCVIIAVAVGAWHYASTTDSREEAAEQAFIQEVGTDIDDYFPEDTVQEFVHNYIDSHLDEVKSDFNLYSESDMDSLYNDAQSAMESAYADGWSDACDNYGIDIGTEDIPDYGYYGRMTEPASSTAYITPTGKCYHLSQSCAGENAIQTTIAEVGEKGYTPCANCVQ